MVPFASVKKIGLSRPVTRACLSILIMLSLSACLPFLSGDDTDHEATITAMQATIDAKPTSTPQPTAAPTNTPAPPTTIPPTLPPPPTAAAVTQAPQSPANIEELILNSNVLLYEDMAGNPDVFRYVSAALQRLGFREGSYMDTGDAQGRFLTAMAGNAPNGKPWDLIIIANEDRDGIQGTFFEVLEPILNRGDTRVIMEMWHLDEIQEGTVKPILLRCGVNVSNWEGSSSADLNLYAPDSNHPLLNEVVPVHEFKLLDYWMWYVDLGDLMYLTGTGDAKIALSAQPGDSTQAGVLTECYDGRLILQTFSSHNYQDETMVSLWANYIHNALREKHGG